MNWTQGEKRRGTRKERIYTPIAAAPCIWVSLCASSIPSFIGAGTSWLQQPPGSPLLLDRILPWKTAQSSARVCICPLSSPSPFPLLSTVFFAGLSTGCSAGRDVPASGPPSSLRRRTTSLWRPLGGPTDSCRLRWVHARTLVCRSWQPVTWHLSSELVAWSPPWRSVCSWSACCTC